MTRVALYGGVAAQAALMAEIEAIRHRGLTDAESATLEHLMLLQRERARAVPRQIAALVKRRATLRQRQRRTWSELTDIEGKLRDLRGGPRSARSRIAEMIALETKQRGPGLTAEEAERLGELVVREQRDARTRPARIAVLRAELELLETLEMAERGAAAEGCALGEPVELARDDAGDWSPVRRAA